MSDRKFETTMEIGAPRDTVWQALSSAEALKSWFPVGATMDPRVGGQMTWSWGEIVWPLTIEEFAPGERLLARYESDIDTADGKANLVVDFRLEGDGGTTTLRFVHSGFGPGAEFDQEYDGISRGWPVELSSLRLYCEKHAGDVRHHAWSTREVPGSLDDAWAILTSEDGFACGTAVDSLESGAPFRIESSDGDVWEGTTLHCNDREFTGIATSHDDAFLRIGVENCGGKYMAWLWMATWGDTEENVAGLQDRWDAMLGRLFATETAGEGAA